MSKGAFGKPRRLKGKDGHEYDFKNNLVDGAPPVEEGDVFFYRARGQASAQVMKVKLTKRVGKIGWLVLLNSEDKPESFMYVDLTRIEVVQSCAPVEFNDQPFEELILRNHHLMRDWQGEEIGDIELSHFPPEYALDIQGASRVVVVVGDLAKILKDEADGPDNRVINLVSSWDELESPAKNSGSPPIKHQDFPPASPGGD